MPSARNIRPKAFRPNPLRGCLDSAGTIAAGTLGSAAPANAADTFLALAYQQSDGFGSTLVYRDAHGVGQFGVYDTARINALNDCQHNGGQTGGGQCEVRVVAT